MKPLTANVLKRRAGLALEVHYIQRQTGLSLEVLAKQAGISYRMMKKIHNQVGVPDYVLYTMEVWMEKRDASSKKA